MSDVVGFFSRSSLWSAYQSWRSREALIGLIWRRLADLASFPPQSQGTGCFSGGFVLMTTNMGCNPDPCHAALLQRSCSDRIKHFLGVSLFFGGPFLCSPFPSILLFSVFLREESYIEPTSRMTVWSWINKRDFCESCSANQYLADKLPLIHHLSSLSDHFLINSL